MLIDTTVRIWREGEHYVAHAMPIDLASAGPTQETAKAALREAIALFISTADAEGNLNEVLEECGYHFDGAKWVAPSLVEHQQTVMSV
jgi:predicted RNase H-like HicB family nuclease